MKVLERDGLQRGAEDARLAPGAPEIADVDGIGADTDAPGAQGPSGEEMPRATWLRTQVAASLSATAAAWMAGGIFRSDMAARGLGVLGVAVAVALTLLGTRLRRPTTMQLLVVPVSVVLGALLVLPSAGGSATIPSLVGDALHAGGILQPPIALDPGWRLVLIVLFAGVCSAATTLSLSLDRPMLAVALPIPVVAVAALVQPPGAELLAVGGAVVLLAAALAVAYGADLSRASELGASFERGRLMRGAALVTALVVAVVGVGHVGVLFPQTDSARVVPPQPPHPQPPGPDRSLFAVRFTGGDTSPPLRTGVLDVYDGNAQQWLLPSYDTSRMDAVRPPAALPGAPSGNGVQVQVTIRDFPGHVLPAVPGANHVGGTAQPLRFDPRTGQIELADQPAYGGLTYTLTAPSLPSAKQLEEAPAAPQSMHDFLSMPAPPPTVATLLASVASQNPFDRMQSLRKALYDKVVAAGGGSPSPVSPQRVAQMLAGGKANPFEITAAEAMLARWAGVPSRIAFGYEPQTSGDGTYEVHPRDGAAWLEAWFQGYGWLPILGAPPHAQATFDRSQRNTDSSITPSDKLGLVVYVPVQEHTTLALYEEAQWWLLRALPVALAVLLLLALYPATIKRLRRARRTRWALQRGPAARIAVAYAEFRDAMRDLAVGDPVLTPLLFLREIAGDDEHAELAWLVTRALWGDLRRDLRDSDAEAAETLARSVQRRTVRAQSPLDRALALIARTSLRAPYSDEVPNLWPRLRVAPPRRLPGLRPVLLRRRVAAAGATVLLAVLCSTLLPAGTPVTPAAARNGSSQDDAALDSLVPQSVGPLALLRQRSVEAAFRSAGPGSLVTGGHVYTIHNGDVIEGSVQVSTLRPDLDRTSSDVVDGLRRRLAGGSFLPMMERVPLDDGACACPGQYTDVPVKDEALRFHQRIWVSVLPDQRIYFWFPPQAHTLEVVVIRAQFPALSADELVLTMSDRQHGAPLVALPVPPIAAEQAGAQQP